MAHVDSVWAVKYGERVVRKNDVFWNYQEYGLPDGDLDMDYSYWVIKAGDKTILMDTGYDIPKHDWLGEILVTPTPESLKIIGVDPREVHMVITSHYHYDHIGYLGLFENAVIVSGQREHDYWFAKRDADELVGEFTTAEDLAPIQKARNEGRLRLISEQTEVFPGITVFQVGGHCPGEVVAMVETTKGPLILASDAAHFYEQLEHEWPFFAYTSLDEMRAALSFILQLAKDKNATIIPGHDGRTRAKFPAAPGEAGQVATVLA
jgi:glyoxylase-like metal-dependent hydrolase (beta-lactamase superfamily II)